METPQASDLMKEGDVILFRGNKFFSKIIRARNAVTLPSNMDGYQLPTHATIVSDVDGNNVTTYETYAFKVGEKTRDLSGLPFEDDTTGSMWIGTLNPQYELVRSVAECYEYFKDCEYPMTDVLFKTAIGKHLNYDFPKNPTHVSCGGLIVHMLELATNGEVNVAKEMRKRPNLVASADFLDSKYFSNWKQVKFS